MNHLLDALAVVATAYVILLLLGAVALGALRLRDTRRAHAHVEEPDAAEERRRQIRQERAATDALGYPVRDGRRW